MEDSSVLLRGRQFHEGLPHQRVGLLNCWGHGPVKGERGSLVADGFPAGKSGRVT